MTTYELIELARMCAKKSNEERDLGNGIASEIMGRGFILFANLADEQAKKDGEDMTEVVSRLFEKNRE